MPPSSSIVWPEKYDPARAPIHVRNEIDIAAPCERAWAWLIRAQLWPSWYDNSSNVRFLDGTPPDLGEGTRFRWRTFSVGIESHVREFVPPFRISWAAHGIGVDAYHAWLLEPTPNGCRVITEETQYGFVARLGKLVLPNRMSRGHQRWLEGLRDHAQRGQPPE
ncbi:MAG TPA: SRPBCC domain-containing protein [Thermoanaerobaculia bacterium]|jgi:uncharacterized protein YndB with AHSA1/START domain